MLKQLRKKGVAKKILWVVTIIIIPSFGIFWQTSRYEAQSVTYAGKIFGQKVSFDEFQKGLLHTTNQDLLRYGENFYKISQYLNLNSETWDRLILLYEAKKRRIKIIDREVIDAIEDFDFFKSKGGFDPKMYNHIVRYVFRCEPREFEEGVRESLMFAKIYEQETAGVSASEGDALKEYKKQNDKVQVSYIEFNPDHYDIDLALDMGEAEAYFKNHQEEFRMPPAINLQYLSLEFSPDAKEDEKKAMKETAGNISQDLKTEADLEKIAKKYNLAIKESGFFNQEQPNLNTGLPLDLLQQAFTLTQGQTVGPLETEKGYYILRLKEKKDSTLPSFTEVREKVIKALSSIQAKKLAQKKASETLQQIKEIFKNNKEANFSEAVKSLSFSVAQTPLFKQGDYLAAIGPSNEFQNAAFSLNDQNSISDVVETAKGYYILHRDAFTPTDVKEFAKVKEDLIKKLSIEKKNGLFNAFISRLRTKANLVDHISKLRKNNQPD